MHHPLWQLLFASLLTSGEWHLSRRLVPAIRLDFWKSIIITIYSHRGPATLIILVKMAESTTPGKRVFCLTMPVLRRLLNKDNPQIECTWSSDVKLSPAPVKSLTSHVSAVKIAIEMSISYDAILYWTFVNDDAIYLRQCYLSHFVLCQKYVSRFMSCVSAAWQSLIRLS